MFSSLLNGKLNENVNFKENGLPFCIKFYWKKLELSSRYYENIADVNNRQQSCGIFNGGDQ